MALTKTQRAAFERMRDTEMVLDDIDYLTESPRLREAMKAAEEFRAALDSDPLSNSHLKAHDEK